MLVHVVVPFDLWLVSMQTLLRGLELACLVWINGKLMAQFISFVPLLD